MKITRPFSPAVTESWESGGTAHILPAGKQALTIFFFFLRYFSTLIILVVFASASFSSIYFIDLFMGLLLFIAVH